MLRFPTQLLTTLAAAALLMAVLAPFAQAQEQEAEMQRKLRLNERLAPKPDTTLEFVPRTPNGKPLVKAFNAPNARVKPFIFRDKFNAKEFRTTAFRSKAYEAKEFNQVKAYETADALTNWRNSANPNGMVRDAPGVKGFEVAEAREGSAELPTNTAPREYASRPATLRGKSQGDLDREYNERPALSIDQVRELLNKNK